MPESPTCSAALPPLDGEDPLAFHPVPSTSMRHDGWTPERQRRFIQALSVMGVVALAARAVGMSSPGAYKLRARPDATTFAEAWDIALAMGRDRAFAVAYDRAVNGYTVPRFYRGKQVGTIHRFDNRMLVAALNPISPPPQDAVARGVFAEMMEQKYRDETR